MEKNNDIFCYRYNKLLGFCYICNKRLKNYKLDQKNKYVKFLLKSCTAGKKVVSIICRNFLTQLIVGIALQKISCRNFLTAKNFDQIGGQTPLCLIKGDPTMFNNFWDPTMFNKKPSLFKAGFLFTQILNLKR